MIHPTWKFYARALLVPAPRPRDEAGRTVKQDVREDDASWQHGFADLARVEAESGAFFGPAVVRPMADSTLIAHTNGLQ